MREPSKIELKLLWKQIENQSFISKNKYKIYKISFENYGSPHLLSYMHPTVIRVNIAAYGSNWFKHSEYRGIWWLYDYRYFSKRIK